MRRGWSALATAGSDDATDRADAVSAAAGDTDAFERIYRRHVARIHSLCRRMLGAEEADDACQEIFVRAWRKLGGFRGDAALGTWLFRLAVNLILGRRTQLGRRRQRIDARDPADLGVPARAARVDLRMDFEAAIAMLPERARAVFLLYDVEGYTHEEIADMLGVTTGTTKSQLHRARMALRRHLH